MERILENLSSDWKNTKTANLVEDGMILGICKITVVHIVILRHFKDGASIADAYEDRLREFGSVDVEDKRSSIPSITKYLAHLSHENRCFLVIKRLIKELVDYSTEIVTGSTDSKKNTDEWCFEMVKALLEKYNEPLLNMHFLSPYMKN